MRAIIEALVDREDPGLIFMFELPWLTEAQSKIQLDVEAILGQKLEDTGRPHITMLYMGKGHSPEDLDLVTKAADLVLSKVKYPIVRPAYVGSFPVSPSSEGRTPVILNLDPESLEDINVKLLRVTAKHNNQNQFVEFSPHMTIGYAPERLTDRQLSQLNALGVPGAFSPRILLLKQGDTVVASWKLA
jgi:2'-5' RNA ligase